MPSKGFFSILCSSLRSRKEKEREMGGGLQRVRREEKFFKRKEETVSNVKWQSVFFPNSGKGTDTGEAIIR